MYAVVYLNSIFLHTAWGRFRIVMSLVSGGFSLTVSIKHSDVLNSTNTSSHAKAHKNQPEDKQVMTEDIFPRCSFCCFCFITFRPQYCSLCGYFFLLQLWCQCGIWRQQFSPMRSVFTQMSMLVFECAEEQRVVHDLQMNLSQSHSLPGWMWVWQCQCLNSWPWIKSSVPSFFSAEFNPWDSLQADWLQWTVIIHA